MRSSTAGEQFFGVVDVVVGDRSVDPAEVGRDQLGQPTSSVRSREGRSGERAEEFEQPVVVERRQRPCGA